MNTNIVTTVENINHIPSDIKCQKMTKNKKLRFDITKTVGSPVTSASKISTKQNTHC